MHEPLLSVIIPVYHVEKYLGRCIDSILVQTYKNLEIILVDDGSDDRCGEICDEYAKRDARVIVIHKENGGVADARNKGLAKATGEYITFVDPDDYINKNMYEEMISRMKKENADIVMCDFKYVYKDNVCAGINESSGNAHIRAINGKEALYRSYDSYKAGILYSVLWNKICKRELYEDIVFPSGRIYEDEARVFMLLYKAPRILFVEYPYYYYHQHDQSIVGKKWTKKNTQLLDAYIDKLEYYEKNKEQALFERELIHVLHMFCYTKRKLSEESIQMDLVGDSQGERCIKIVDKMDNDLSARVKFEYILYRRLTNIYYFIWKLKHKC